LHPIGKDLAPWDSEETDSISGWKTRKRRGRRTRREKRGNVCEKPSASKPVASAKAGTEPAQTPLIFDKYRAEAK
jgi:hypothetical protein